ncbi:MAG TPA: ester cyclase [Terrimicrobiaceae bacterium]
MRRRLSPLSPKTASFAIPIPILESAEKRSLNSLKECGRLFPTFTLNLLNCGEIEPRVVAIHWSLQGTNTGQRREGPPTGRSVTIKGASIIQLEGDKIVLDQCYFDRAAFDAQLAPED